MPKYKSTVTVEGKKYVSIGHIANGKFDISQDNLRYFVCKKLGMKPEIVLSGYQYFSAEQVAKINEALKGRTRLRLKPDTYKATKEIAALVSRAPKTVRDLLHSHGFVPVKIPFNGREKMLWDKSAVSFCKSYYAKKDQQKHEGLYTVRNMADMLNEDGIQVSTAQIYGFLKPNNILPKCKVPISPRQKANAYGIDDFKKVKAGFAYKLKDKPEANCEVAMLKDRLADEESQNKKLSDSLRLYKSQVSEMSAQLQQYTANPKYDGKRRSATELFELLNERDKAIRKYKKQIDKLSADRKMVDDLKIKVDALESRNVSLRKALNAETDGTLELNSKIKKQNENIKLLRKQKGELVEQLEKLHLEMENLKKVNENLTEEPEIANNDAKRTSVISKLKLIFGAQ